MSKAENMKNKAEQFRKNKQAEEIPAAQEADQSQLLQRLAYEMVMKLNSLDARVDELYNSIRINDWRSRAVVKTLDDKGIVAQSDLLLIAEGFIVSDFDAQSETDDKRRNLVATDEPIQDGMYMIAKVVAFRDGVEVDKVVRTKLLVGEELMPELHQAVLGMKAGEKKRFSAKLQNNADSAEVEIIGVRKQTVVEKEPETSAS